MREAEGKLSIGALAAGALLGGWLLACDAWLKLLARSGACKSVETIGAASRELWAVPSGCTPLELGLGLSLSPGVRAGISPWQIALPSGLGAVWGLALIAVATVITVLVLRWRWKVAGDGMALGTFWAGALLHGLPRMISGGATVTELQLAGLGLGVGDLTIGWAMVWLAWRAIAEFRA